MPPGFGRFCVMIAFLAVVRARRINIAQQDQDRIEERVAQPCKALGHVLVTASEPTVAFAGSVIPSGTLRTPSPRMNVAEATTAPAKLKRDRYVATNRFVVRGGKDAKFEQRWANRKSRLATLDGFRYFHLMRRVKLNEDDADYPDDFNYVSFTIWEEKKHFDAWRKGDAFKEAHGGTSILAFLRAMIGSLRVLKGAPKPAFYDGLLLQSTVPEMVPEAVNGWRSVEADGENLLPPEYFVASNHFSINPGQEEAFEARWANRESKLCECDGFITFSMLRRDAPTKEGEVNYVSTTIWRDRAAFDAWRSGAAFGQAHGQKPAGGPPGGKPAGGPPSGGKPAMGMFSKPPTPMFYEAKLVLSSPQGA